jgi:hypothetical protein
MYFARYAIIKNTGDSGFNEVRTHIILNAPDR